MTFEFFNQHFGSHLVAQSGEPHQSAWRALSGNHKLAKGGQNRLVSGWAIVRPGRSSVQQKLSCPAFDYDDRTRFQAFADELAVWDGEPRMFLSFDKAPIPISNLFVTYDLRAVRVCGPNGVETFDATKEPGTMAAMYHRIIWREGRSKQNA